MIDVSHLSAAELSALLHFHADAGVEFLLEDAPINRFQEFGDPGRATVSAPAAPAARSQASDRAAKQIATRQAPKPIAAPSVAIPGEEAVQHARRAALDATSLAELRDAVERFEGCNLRNSARNTVFPGEAGTLPILIVGPAPSVEDDREGRAFSGAHGDLLARMFAAIDLDINEMTLAHAIPWRPPGGRPPTPAEAEICRPFTTRMIELVKPRHVVMLGNFTTRFLTGSADAIHALRGQWFDIGAPGADAVAMLHPQDLMTAPLSKRLAWLDLLEFESRFRSPTS